MGEPLPSRRCGLSEGESIFIQDENSRVALNTLTLLVMFHHLTCTRLYICTFLARSQYGL